MIEQKKLSMKPGLIGCFISVLLIVSFFLPRIWEQNITVESFNTVLIVIIMCLCVHLIRITSSLFFDHVWKNIGFTVLWLIPVFNLVVTASQFIWGNIEFMHTPVFMTLLILFSLPAFCCYYFTVIWLFCKRDKKLMITTSVLDAIGLLYCFIRLADKVILPAFQDTGHNIASLVESMVSFSPMFSLIIYVLSFVNFIICANVFNREKR